jgi:4-amino-4-deoxy-L-arabinose transferase-like glycosyltransferase
MMERSLRRYIREYGVLALILLLAAGLRVWNLDFGLPFRYHIDEPAYVVAAMQIGQGELQISYPPLSPSLQQLIYLALFGVLFIFKFASGVVDSPQSFAGLYRLDPTPFYLLARGVSVASSVLAIACLYGIVRRLRDARTAAVAAFFLAVCFLDIRHAHFAEPYSIVTLLALACTLTALNYYDRGRNKWLVLSGVASGIAIGLRFSVIALGLVPVTALGLRFLAGGSRRPGALVRPAGILAAAAAAGILLGVPGFIVNFRNTVSSILGQVSLVSNVEGFLGIQFTDLPTWQFYATILEIAWGLPLLAAMLAGVARALKQRRPEDLIFAIFPVAFGALLLTASAGSSAFARYAVPALPFLAYLAAAGVTLCAGWLASGRSTRAYRPFLVLLVLALVAIPVARVLRANYLWDQVDTRTQAKAWIETNIPEGARIATQWHGPPLSTASDPEPLSRRVYDVQVIYPFLVEPRFYSIDVYRQRDIDYFIVSSFIYELRLADSGKNEIREAFFQSLDESAQLAAEFKPYNAGREPPFFFEQIWGPITALFDLERPGPTIKIYRLR